MFGFLFSVLENYYWQLMVDAALINRYTVNYLSTRQQLVYFEKALLRIFS
jgi:hypothetical protein